jgi:hypothetical protein
MALYSEDPRINFWCEGWLYRLMLFIVPLVPPDTFWSSTFKWAIVDCVCMVYFIVSALIWIVCHWMVGRLADTVHIFPTSPYSIILPHDYCMTYANGRMSLNNLRRNEYYVVYFLLGKSPASVFYWPTFRNSLSVPSSKAGGWVPKRKNILHLEHGENLKSRNEY